MGKTEDTRKKKDKTGEIVETEDKTETGKKEAGGDTRIEETGIEGSIEEQDLDLKDQEEVNPEDREEAQWDQENNQEDRETNQGTIFTHARGS